VRRFLICSVYWRKAGGVQRIGEQGIVGADRERTEAQKRMASGERVQVQEQFFGCVLRRVALAGVDRILLALFSAREIEIPAQSVWDGEVGLQDAAEHLLVQAFPGTVRFCAEPRPCRRSRR